MEDRNLQLILLQAAWDEELVPAFSKEDFYRDVLGETIDWEADYNYQLDKRVRSALLEIELPLDQLKWVVWDGGLDVFLAIWTYWNGESDHFDVEDLSGIEACTALETLKFNAGARFTDCSPLSGLPKLAEFRAHSEPLEDLRPLLTLPKLASLEVRYQPSDANRAVLKELRAKGVRVEER